MDNFKAMGEKLKSESTQKASQEVAKKEAGANELAAIKANPTLAAMYAENAGLGAENLAGSLPLLKIHATGKSDSNTLSNGEEPNDGYFFYKPTQEQFNGVLCHILTISKGFRAPDMNGKDKFNQIVGGVIVEGGDYKPFIMYVTGMKLSNLWEFGKAASVYTKNKAFPVPMFTLAVKMTTEKKDSSFGKNWIINFEIVKNEDGTPSLVVDPEEFRFLKENVSTVEDTIASLIAAKASAEEAMDGEEVVSVINSADYEGKEPGVVEDTSAANPDDIPF